MLSCFMVFGGFGYLGWQNHEYKVAQSKLAMPNNTQLPLFRGTAKGNLTLKNVMLSKNHCQMAASIGYDDDAHRQLSAFGNKYKLWVVAPNGYPVKDLKVKYGFFGTDGNAILQVNSDKPLPNKAIVIIIVDAGNLVSNEELENGTGGTSDEDIDQSITAQLATGSTQGSSDASSVTTNVSDSVPMYYVRLNPYSAKHTNINWGDNEHELVESLFVKRNLRHIKHQIKINQRKLKQAKITKAEYDKRLKINSQDQTATDGKQEMESTIKGLNTSIEAQNKNYNRLSKARFGKNVLGDQQTKHKSLLTENMQYFTNTGTK